MRNYFDGSFQKETELFSTKFSNNNDQSIDVFITKDRIILLDTSSLLNLQKRDMINSELDDIKTLMLLLNNCHLIINTHDGSPNIAISRLISCSEQLLPLRPHHPLFISIGNNMQPGTKMISNDSRIHNANDSFFIPNFHHSSVALHNYDCINVQEKFQEIVFMKKREKMIESENEPFTEKSWCQRFKSSLNEIKKGDYFSRKYEGLRDKFHQSVET